MTRFERELSGALGAYWKASAEKELDKVREELEKGLITIDENGVARNRLGRVLMDDMLEKLAYITDMFDVDATTKARGEETAKTLAEYRKNAKPATAEQIAEMRAEFGRGRKVVDVITGHTYYL